MFIDEVDITVKGGRGGSGKVSFYPRKKGPDGGDGGNGGSVYAVIDQNLSNLNKYWEKREYEAENGEPGGGFRRKGADGDDITLFFPQGTSLINKETREERELTQDATLLLAAGGKGGRGNNAFKSATHQVPHEFEPGEEGQEAIYTIILRLIADYGLIGLPNAGKSSLLNELTSANVKTAAYPFTTLEPNLGVYNKRIIADIPGLIEGASKGKGLGIKFLKHIEKVKLLFHCIASDSDDVMHDYRIINDELKQFNPLLAEKKQIVLLTKHDLVDNKELEKKKKLLSEFSSHVFPVSIYDPESIDGLKKYLRKVR